MENITETTNLTTDASREAYIDFDVLDLLKEFIDFRAESKNIKIPFIGFKNIYNIKNIPELDIVAPELLSVNERSKKLIRELKRNDKKTKC